MGLLTQRREGHIRVLAGLAVIALVAGCSAPSGVERPGPTRSPAAGSLPSVGSSATPVGQFAEVQIGTMTADEWFSSTTVEEWVRQADHVAVVTVEEEAPVPPATSEIERREGLIGRMLSVRIDSLVWTHPNTTRELPALISFQGFGWAFQGTVESRHRTGVPGQPYLLPGHTYLMALRWNEWGCPGRIDPEDEITPARFGPLGSGAVVPFDGELGAGEFEGQWTRNAGQDDPAGSFRAAMAGQPVDWVVEQLSNTAAGDPGLAHKPGPIDCDGE